MQEMLKNELSVEEKNYKRSRYLCPVCGKHTVLWLFPSTRIKNLPVKCKRCKSEYIVNVTPKSEL